MKSSYKYSIKVHLKMRDFDGKQYITVPAQEAHKIYYLFMNPQARTILSDGTAIIGEDVRHIEPDYVATMKWNQGHKVTAEDMKHIEDAGVAKKLNKIMTFAKKIAADDDIRDMLSLPLTEVKKQKNFIEPPSTFANQLASGMKL